MIRKQNRIKSRAAIKEKFWCHNCDRALASEGSKCPACGTKSNGVRKSKKDPPMEDLNE